MAEKVRSRLRELESEFASLFKSLNEELKRVEADVERGRVDAVEALRGLREHLRGLRSKLIDSRIELRSMLREARLSLRPDEWEELSEEVDEFFERWRDALEDLLDDMRDLARRAERVRRRVVVFTDIGKVIEESLEQTAKGLEAALAKLKEALEKGLEGPSYAVSVRLPQRDLEIVDALVEAGIFKSRSEAIAFFAHKGIESSRHLFNEALAKLEELKALREKLREELKRAFGEGQQASS
ncbi:MAG: ribbon-helix-helix protein, CopG family [Thermofilaceae archaeon]